MRSTVYTESQQYRNPQTRFVKSASVNKCYSPLSYQVYRLGSNHTIPANVCLPAKCERDETLKYRRIPLHGYWPDLSFPSVGPLSAGKHTHITKEIRIGHHLYHNLLMTGSIDRLCIANTVATV